MDEADKLKQAVLEAVALLRQELSQGQSQVKKDETFLAHSSDQSPPPDYNELRQRLEALDRKHQQLLIENQNLLQASAADQETINKLRANIAGLSQLARAEHTRAIEGVSSAGHEAYLSEIDSLNQEISRLKSRCVEAEVEIASLQENQSTLKRQKKILAKNNADLEFQLSDLQEQLKKALRDIEVLSDTNEDLNTELDQLSAQLELEAMSHDTTDASLTYDSRSWQFLPAGSWDMDDVIAHYQREAANFPPELRDKPIELERLHRIKELKPSQCVVGKEGWLGYAVFIFHQHPNVLIECPIYGNATYVVARNVWESATRGTKQELRRNFGYCRHKHTDSWFLNIRLGLQKHL